MIRLFAVILRAVVKDNADKYDKPFIINIHTANVEFHIFMTNIFKSNCDRFI